MRINFQPVFLTSLTTALGFLSLNFSDAPPFRHLGTVVAMGVGAAWLLSVFMLPAFVSLVPIRKWKALPQGPSWSDRWADSMIRNRKLGLAGSLIVVAILACFIPRIELNDQWVEYFAPGIEFRDDTDYAMDHLTGIYTLEYSFESGESGGINNPEYLEKLSKNSQIGSKKQPGVLQAHGMSDVMKRLNKNMHGDDPDWYRLPDQRDLAAQYLLLFEMSLPYGLDLNNVINVDKSASRVTVTLGNISAGEVRARD
jgi:predicted RND superfamily exporter protein